MQPLGVRISTEPGDGSVCLLIGLTFQPSELAKIAIMMFTARILSEAQTDTHCDDSVLQKFLLFVGPVILLIFMDNFSTSALIGAVCFILFMIARMRWRFVGDDLGNRFGGRLLWC